jgi:hypothetical protein
VPAQGGFPNNGNGGVATYDAVVNATGAAYAVHLATDITVEDLLVNSATATINHTAGTLTATGAIGLSAGTFKLNGGRISNTTINVSGSGALSVGAFSYNMLAGVTVNGDLILNTSPLRRVAFLANEVVSTKGQSRILERNPRERRILLEIPHSINRNENHTTLIRTRVCRSNVRGASCTRWWPLPDVYH